MIINMSKCGFYHFFTFESPLGSFLKSEYVLPQGDFSVTRKPSRTAKISISTENKPDAICFLESVPSLIFEVSFRL